MVKSDASWGPYSLILGLVGITLVLVPFQPGSFGTLDFIQYWSAWRLMSNGQNPYDPALMYELKRL